MDDTKFKNFTSCFKDQKFLNLFFKKLTFNRTGRYKTDFPYVSLCGKERNFVRCDDFPIVYTHIKCLPDYNDKCQIFYGYAGDSLAQTFQPQKVAISKTTGRVYHPAPKKVGGIGLVRSALATELSKYLKPFDQIDVSPTHFSWNGKEYELEQWCEPEKLDLYSKNRNKDA